MAVTTAAILTGASIAATAGSAGMNFSQAAKQRDLRAKAEEDSKKMMEEARRRINVNPFDAISLPVDAYRLESEANLQQGAQLTESARESERGVGATAGRVQMAQQAGQAAIRGEMGKALTDLEMASAEEEGNIRNRLASVDLAEVEGAQLAMADAQKAEAAYTKQAFSDVANLTGQLAAAAPLFSKTAGARQYGKFEQDYNKMVQSGKTPAEFMGANNQPLSAADAYAKINNFTPEQMKQAGQLVTGTTPMGTEYTSYQMNPYAVRAMDLDARNIRNIRKDLANPQAFESLPLYEPGITYR